MGHTVTAPEALVNLIFEAKLQIARTGRNAVWLYLGSIELDALQEYCDPLKTSFFVRSTTGPQIEKFANLEVVPVALRSHFAVH